MAGHRGTSGAVLCLPTMVEPSRLVIQPATQGIGSKYGCQHCSRQAHHVAGVRCHKLTCDVRRPRAWWLARVVRPAANLGVARQTVLTLSLVMGLLTTVSQEACALVEQCVSWVGAFVWLSRPHVHLSTLSTGHRPVISFRRPYRGYYPSCAGDSRHDQRSTVAVG